MIIMSPEAENALKELLRSSEMYCTPSQVAPLLGCKSHTLNVLAEQGKLNMQHVVLGKNLRIFRIPFLRQLGYDVDPPFAEEMEKEKAPSK